MQRESQKGRYRIIYKRTIRSTWRKMEVEIRRSGRERDADRVTERKI